MRTGRLSISRGHQRDEGADFGPPPRLALVPSRAEPAPDPPASPSSSILPDYHAIHDRLTALERLTQLLDHGALSAEEFAAEKRLILALPADGLVLRAVAPVHFVPAEPGRPQRGPSLIGRMVSWRFLVFALVMGLGSSFAAQPDEAMRLVDQTLRYFGA